MLINLVEETIKRIHGIIENSWSEERLPVDWDTTLVCNIHKKNPLRNTVIIDGLYYYIKYINSYHNVY